LGAFHPVALDMSRRTLSKGGRVHAMCGDYGAGVTIDLDHGRRDLAGEKAIGCPTKVLLGKSRSAVRRSNYFSISGGRHSRRTQRWIS
jgi:hypothetical protein